MTAGCGSSSLVSTTDGSSTEPLDGPPLTVDAWSDGPNSVQTPTDASSNVEAAGDASNGTGDAAFAQDGDGPLDAAPTFDDASSDAPANGGPVCETATGLSDAGVVPCSRQTPCDPAPPEGGRCSDVPSYTAGGVSSRLWIEDPAAPQGGWRIDLPCCSQTVTIGGHTYADHGDGLNGNGANGVYGDLFVTVDGRPQEIHFHYEGWPTFLGGGVWDWEASLTRTRASCSNCTPATVTRHYVITRTGACGPWNHGTYTFVADEPPRGCGLGVDLLQIVLSGA